MNIKYILLQSFRCVLFVLTFAAISFCTRTTLTDLSKWWSVIASILNIITILVLIFFCKKEKISYSKLINYTKRSTKIKSVVWTTSLFLIIGMGGMYLAGFLCYGKFPYLAAMMVQPIPIIFAIINVVVLPLTTTLAEDGLYLGVGVNHIRNKWAAIFIPAFFYAIQHSFIPTLPDFQYVLYRFLSFLPLTIVMCYLYRKNRNPVPFMVGHFVINIATVAQILMTSLYPELFELMKNM